MRPIFTAFLLSLFISFSYAQVPEPGSEGKIKLVWESDFESGIKKAEAEKKPVVLDVTTDWCGWSKKMERETFANSEVQEKLKECVLIRINPEASEKNQEVAKKYDVSGYPNLIILNFKGEVMAQDSGYQDAKEFVKFLKNYLEGFKNNPLGYTSEKLPPDDVLMKAIAKMPKPETLPPQQGSIVLLDYSKASIDQNYVAKMTNRQSWYILDPDQEPFVNVFRTYNSSREKFKFLSVRLVDANGQTRNFNVNLAEDEHAYSNQNIYWDLRKVSLNLPNLKAGQILDVVEEREIKPVMPNQFSWKWITSYPIIIVGDLTVSFPETIKLKKYPVRNATPIEETKNADGTVTWKLITNNLQLPEPEIYAPNGREEWQGYDFCTDATWDSIGVWFKNLCAGRDQLPPDAKAKVAELKKTHAKPEAQLQAIFDWVTKDIRYVAVMFGQSSHQPHPATETLKNLYGDCKDQALLIHALCKEAGIKSNLILVSSGYGHQFSSTAPDIYKFDHCIVEAKIGETSYFLDATGGPSSIDRLPYGCCLAQALRIGETVTEVITLPAYKPEEGAIHKKIIQINPNGSAVITDIQELKGPRARLTKQSLRGTDMAKVRKALEEGYKKNGQKLLEFTMTPPEDKGDTYQSKLSFTLPRFASRSSEGLVFKLVDEKGEDWTATLEAPRVRPFHFNLSDPMVTTYEIELPKGSTLKTKVEDLTIKSSFLEASRKISITDNKLSVTERSLMLDAKLPATESKQVFNEFKKLQDHREQVFIVSVPAAAP